MGIISLDVPPAKERLRLKNLIKAVLRNNPQGVERQALLAAIVARFPQINLVKLTNALEDLIQEGKANER